MIATENQLGSRAGSGLGQYEEAAATITNGNGGGGNGTGGNGGSAAAVDATTLENAGTAMKKEEQEGGAATPTPPTAAPPMPGVDDEDEDEEEDAEEEEEEEEDDEEGGIAVEGVTTAAREEIGGMLAGEGGGGGGMAGYWRQSRPSSPRMPPPEQSEQPRPKSRQHEPTGARYNNLGYWRARRVTFYKNGDPYFPGVEFRFKPGRDIGSLEALLDRLSLRLDLPRGARHIFSMDGDRKISLDELEDGASYVVSSYKTFKPASYGKKNNTWYTNPAPGGGGGSRSGAVRTGSGAAGGWQSRPPAVASLSRKASISDEAPPPGGGGKPSSGRVIRIVNNHDHTVQCRVLLNLRTSQPFEEVLEDLGQVLKMNGAKRMFTVSGQEVRSFSQLRNEFADVDTFYLGTGSVLAGAITSPARRSRSRGPSTVVEEVGRQRRARSKSRPRALYAADSEVVRVNDYSVVEVLREEPARVTIRGLRRSFYPPSHLPPVDNSPPEKKLQLEWVYGYRGTDTRRNLWVLPSGELLYYVAAVAILFDREENAQRHYIGHTEDITCMEVHPSRELVASGQRAGRHRKAQPHVRIWSTETLLTLYVFGMSEFQMGVSALAFSQLNGGSYVLAVDAGREAILSVWQWQWGHLLGKVATMQEDLTGAAFHPLDDNLLITHGRGHLTFWNRRKDGFFERTDIIKPPSRTHVTSIQFEQDGDVVTADSDGFITVYSVDADGAYFVRMEFEAHNKGISSLVMLSEGTLLSGGEKDRKIAAWDSLQNYKRITDTKLPESVGGVRSIYPQRPGRNDGNIYVGTTRNNILEGSLQRRFNQVVFGHGRQLWGLAVHPDDEVFATAGHDKNIALWRRHKLLWTTQVGFECICIAFHPFGVALAAGSSEGHLLVLAADTGAAVATLRVCGSPLSCIGYNPTGEIVAMGSQNGSVYLFRVSRDGFSYKKSNKIRGTQPLIQLDWSSDSRFLQTVTQDYDLVFWDVKVLSSEKSPLVMKDVKWYTHNCTVGYMVSGMWNNRYYPLTTVVTTSSRSAAHDMLVSGDAEGYLRLFRYPCTSAKAEYVEEKVYSSLVACARFLYNDQNVVTVGGTDAALMLWELVDE
ncbi:echinoderm microtubule-associated protein-like CG42247 isoform X1 [Odontomachus brunneus]|uniref:echinoderm microtubule-associated protein-like CG42247 isoform X1 n=1 Tax=Odontomachus brunneus TaxID=486640 RepID=UPI0013F1B141|nr:echinoderm microtubule-associated protein-like CG42247 isoform X1 [Odontomachus brunneus]